MELIKNAELFAKDCHAGKTTNGITYTQHLEDVVNRLKGLGVIDNDVLCAGWLCDILENTDTTFDDVYQKFGNIIAVLISSISKDMTVPRKQRNKEFTKQLKDASFDAKLIKLCDISANLSDLKYFKASKSKIMRQIRQNRHHARKFPISSSLYFVKQCKYYIQKIRSAKHTLKQYVAKNLSNYCNSYYYCNFNSQLHVLCNIFLNLMLSIVQIRY